MSDPRDPILDLFWSAAIEGTTPETETKLQGHPGVRLEDFESVAATAQVALMPETEMPAGMQARLERAADAFVAGWEAPPATSLRTRVVTATDPVEPNRAVSWGGWVVALAASLVALFTLWRPNQTAEDPAALFARLSSAEDAIEVAFVTPVTAGLQEPDQLDRTARSFEEGAVVWSSTEDRGVMRFKGLLPNNPKTEQYQLWIFDPTQPEKTPIDGGVFNVTSGDEVFVSIDAKLDVTAPTLFAITVEKPGGVVVSSRDRLPLVAPVGA